MWDDEVMKERAKIHAQHNPFPPLPAWRRALLVLFLFIGMLMSYAAWRVMIA